MINKFLPYFLILIFIYFLSSCNRGEKKDTSELYAKSQTRGAIIERSGTIFRDEDTMWKDALNREQTGGGMLGKKPAPLIKVGEKDEPGQGSASIGFPINPYLWKGALETISFMPLSSADPFAGIIITDWYSGSESHNQRCKLNIFIKGVELKTSNLRVNSFCQNLSQEGNWIDQKINTKNNIKLENTILNKAKKIRLSQS